MAERFYSGRDATIWFGTSSTAEQAKVVDWSMKSSTGLLDTTTLGDKHRDYIPGLVGYSGSATLLYYQDSSNAVEASSWLTNAGISTAASGVSTDNKVTMEFRLYGGGSGYKQVKVNAYLTSASLGVSVGDIVKTNFSFTVCGAPTEADL